MKLSNLVWPAVIVVLIGFIGWRTMRPPAPPPEFFHAATAATLGPE